VGLFNPDYKRASQMDSVTDPDTVRTLLLKSFYEELGLTVDTTRKMARELHMLFYPKNDGDLARFRNITEFSFIRAFRLNKTQSNIFGDLFQRIYIYKIKSGDVPGARYVVFFLDPTGKVVLVNLDD
jgi:hypothetical protein